MRFALKKSVSQQTKSETAAAARLGVLVKGQKFAVQLADSDDVGGGKRRKQADLEVDTPNAILYTHKGSIPHLSLDIQNENHQMKSGILSYFYEHMYDY